MDYFKRLNFSIAAAATAHGGPVVVYRVSGKNLSLLAKEFAVEDRVAKHAEVFGIDHGIVLYFKGPKSFTGEDVMEFHLHGSDRIGERFLLELKKREIFDALPGEFSFRAFMNGKMTLEEAESLHTALTVAANSSASSELLQLSKIHQQNTKKKFAELEDSVRTARGRLESAIDFSEAEEEQKNDVLSTRETLTILRRKLDEFVTTYKNFYANIRTPKILIVGETNVGKSTFLNLLLGSDRILVSDTHGTTRDYIEASVKIQNRNFIFVDTAGIRGLNGEKIDDVEKAGIERAIQLIDDSHAVVWVRSSETNANSEIEKFLKNKKEEGRLLIVESFGDRSQKTGAFDLRQDSKSVREYLEEKLIPFFSEEKIERTEVFLSERQGRLLETVQEKILTAIESLDLERPLEIVAEDLRHADEALKKASGREISDDYVAEIFSQFCLGK